MAKKQYLDLAGLTTYNDEIQAQLDGKSNTGHNHICYGVCETAADTVAKTVTVNNFSLVEGATVIVKFTNANSIASPTLNVNGTGAKPIYRYGTTTASTGTTTTGWVAGAVQMFTYDGAGWIRDYWNNTTYSNASLGCGYATCSTAAATVAKTASLSSYSLTTGGIIAVKFTYDVPASATLNISSKGAKNIYFRGAAITAGVIKAGDIATFIYSSQYHLISIDRWQNDIASIQTTLNSKVDSLSDLGITATATELNYIDGVTSNIQTQLDALSSDLDDHEHSGSDITSGTVAAARLPVASDSAAGIVSTSTQKFKGNKTFTGTVTVNNLDANTTSSMIGTSMYPFDSAYINTLNIGSILDSGSVKNGGVFKLSTAGTTTTNGVTTLQLGNNVASGTTGNAYGVLEIYNKNTGRATIRTNHTDDRNIYIELPENGGTLVTDDDLAACTNQNAFSNVTVGSTTIAADSATDTLTLVAGSNVTLTPDATNDKITIAATDTKYTHPTTSGNKHIPSGGSSGQILRWSADGTAAWGADNNTTYGVVSTTADGLAPKRDGSTTKFLRADGTWAVPPDNDTVYTHPAYTARTGVPTANQTPAFGGTFTVNQVNSDATGHVTAATSRTITIPSTAASASAAGLVNTGTQTFAGAKTFNSQITASSGIKIGNATLTYDSSAGALKITFS